MKELEVPFFSVIVPVYNKGPHIKRSINSILNQSFRNFEIIIINDGSTDNSLEEILKFKDFRIRLFHRIKPGPGASPARNLGISQAKGEWIAFLDADDEWFPYHLERAYELISHFPDVYIISCGWQIKLKDQITENAFFKRYKKYKLMKINLTFYLNSCLRREGPICTSVAIIKRSSPICKDLFPVGSKRGEDLFAWLKMLCFHKEMAWSNYIGAIYHTDSVNMVTKKAPAPYELFREDLINHLTIYLNEKERILFKKYINYLKREALIIKLWVEIREPMKKYLGMYTDIISRVLIKLIKLIPTSIIVKFIK
jgi:glycosyltransferase involved in cell wall biosynthesis